MVIKQEKGKAQNVNGEDFIKMGLFAAATLVGAKKISDFLTDNRRKSTALEKFDEQKLSRFDEYRLKNAYRKHNFYVTRFPNTPKEIFPLAVDILFNLIQFHTKPFLDKQLAKNILIKCENLHQIALKLNFHPISAPWPYWMLVADRRRQINSIWGPSYEYQYSQRSNWNLESFLNGNLDQKSSVAWAELNKDQERITFERAIPGIIRYGIFGLPETKNNLILKKTNASNARIDVKLYQKGIFGTLNFSQEIDETKSSMTLQYLSSMLKIPKNVIVIYDLIWIDNVSTIRIQPSEYFKLVDIPYRLTYDSNILSNFRLGGKRITLIQNENEIKVQAVGQEYGGSIGCAHASVVSALHILLLLDDSNQNSALFHNVSDKINSKNRLELISQFKNHPNELYPKVKECLDIDHTNFFELFINDHISKNEILIKKTDIDSNPQKIKEIVKTNPIIVSLDYYRHPLQTVKPRLSPDLKPTIDSHTILIIAYFTDSEGLEWFLCMDPDLESWFNVGKKASPILETLENRLISSTGAKFHIGVILNRFDRNFRTTGRFALIRCEYLLDENKWYQGYIIKD